MAPSFLKRAGTYSGLYNICRCSQPHLLPCSHTSTLTQSPISAFIMAKHVCRSTANPASQRECSFIWSWDPCPLCYHNHLRSSQAEDSNSNAAYQYNMCMRASKSMLTLCRTVLSNLISSVQKWPMWSYLIHTNFIISYHLILLRPLALIIFTSLWISVSQIFRSCMPLTSHTVSSQLLWSASQPVI